MIACHREPTLAEILSDPVIEAAMAADGVDPGEVETLLRRIRATRLEDGRASRPFRQALWTNASHPFISSAGD